MTRSDVFALRLRKAVLASAAGALIATAFAAPAAAGGKHRHGYYGGHYYGDYHWRDYRGYRHDYRRGRGHLSGGEAALIAAGIIGGVILIDSALDRRDRDYDRRYDDYRYDDYRYERRRYDDRRYEDRRGAFDDDYYYRRDDRFSDNAYDDRGAYRDSRAVDDGSGLLGGDEKLSGATRVAADAAFRECVAETRGAAGAGGMTLAVPGAPSEVEELPDGAVRMTAQFRASNARGDQWTRRMVCEADEQGIRFLQVD